MSYSDFSTKGNAPSPLYTSRSVTPFVTNDIFPALLRAGMYRAFKLNPRAPPFIPGAYSHPLVPVSSSSPTKSDMSSASTVLAAAPLATWHHFAPRVPIIGPNGAGPVGHPGYAAYPGYTQDTRYRSRGETVTQASYSAGMHHQAEGFSNGFSAVNNTEVPHGAAYYPMGGLSWPGMYDHSQPVYASAPQYAAGHYGGWNNQGHFGGKKKKNPKKKGKKSEGSNIGGAW